eukprot:816477-Pleurochrysis_carterae.AAC.1
MNVLRTAPFLVECALVFVCARARAGTRSAISYSIVLARRSPFLAFSLDRHSLARSPSRPRALSPARPLAHRRTWSSPPRSLTTLLARPLICLPARSFTASLARPLAHTVSQLVTFRHSTSEQAQADRQAETEVM